MKINSERSGCQDVFNAFLVNDAIYEGKYEMPCIVPSFEIPKRLIVFSKCISSNDFDAYVHFYQDDYLFERLWRNPRKYLDILGRFKGVILLDFSTYYDM
ncbi:MAG: DUF4417 domain-containing protein, partial [Lachnospiraceae bacterium]|nr:DUF4417 domain-containing protein [Lachnospiraceae bacterium]